MLKSSQLRAHLEQGAKEAYLIINAEPVLQAEDRDLIRSFLACAERQCLLVDTSFDMDEALAEVATGNLFGGSILFEFLLAEPLGAALGKQLEALASAARDNGHKIVVACASIASRGKWSKLLEETFTVVSAAPISSSRMAGWIKARARQIKLEIDDEAAGFLATNTENNLSNAVQELEKLLIVHGENAKIGLAALLEGVSDETRDDLRSLRETLANGDSARALRAVRNLKATKESPVLIVWALAEELRALQSLQRSQAAWGVFGAHRSALERLARRVSRDDVQTLQAAMAKADWAAKGLRDSSPWLRIERLTGAFANLARHNRLEVDLL